MKKPSKVSDGQKRKARRQIEVCDEKQLDFAIFIIYSLAECWKKAPAQVYRLLNDLGILDDYILPCYDVLHTLGSRYLVEDISEFARERGVSI